MRVTILLMDTFPADDPRRKITSIVGVFADPQVADQRARELTGPNVGVRLDTRDVDMERIAEAQG